MEAASRGAQVSGMVRELGYFGNARKVERDFSQICDRIVELTSALQNGSGVRTISPTWRQIPEPLRSRPELARALTENRYFQENPPETFVTWIQHGDLSVENTHLDRKSGQLEVFDWGDLAGGFPPLYDLFQFFYSPGYLPPEQETVSFPSEEERWMATFKAIFLTDSGFGSIARRLILRASERLKVLPKQVPSLLLEFLIVRANYYRRTSAVQHRVQCRLLELSITELERLRLGW
jgi:hypothetical protein